MRLFCGCHLCRLRHLSASDKYITHLSICVIYKRCYLRSTAICCKHNRHETSLHAVSLSPLHVNETAMKNADYTQQTFSMCVLVSGLHFLTMKEKEKTKSSVMFFFSFVRCVHMVFVSFWVKYFKLNLWNKLKYIFLSAFA